MNIFLQEQPYTNHLPYKAFTLYHIPKKFNLF